MKKILSILLVLCMMISLTSALATVSFAADDEGGEETTTTVSTTEFFDDEWNAKTYGFTAEVYDAHGARVGEPNTEWNKAALKWLQENGYKGCDELGETYYLEQNEDGGYEIKKGATGQINRYFISNQKRTQLLDKSKVNNELVYGSAWIKTDIQTGNITVPVNKYPLDFDIKLGSEAREISGLRIYRTYNGDTTVNEDGSKEYGFLNKGHGSYVTKYDLYVKFEGDSNYTCLIMDGTNSDNKTFDVDLGYKAKVTDVRLRVKDTSNQVSAITGYNIPGYVSIGGITVLTKDENNTTYESNSALTESIISKTVDTRVIGSLENKRTIETMESSFGEEAVSDYRTAYTSKNVKEVEATFTNPWINYTLVSRGKNEATGEPTITKQPKSLSASKLIDGDISPDNMPANGGANYWLNADHGVNDDMTDDSEKYVTLTLPVTCESGFTGIRFYSRKSHQYNFYLIHNAAKYADIKLYDGDSNYITAANLESVKGEEHGIINEGNTSLKITEDKNGTAYDLTGMKDAGGYDQDIRYVDFNLKFNDTSVRAKDVAKIVIVIKTLWGGGRHWGSEEIRLINDESVENEKTVSGIIADMIDTRVIGSLENKDTIEAAEKVASESAVASYRNEYNNKTVKELETTFGTVTATSPHKKGDGSETSGDDTDAGIRGAAYLTDGKVTDDTVQSGNYTAVDWSVYPDHTTPQYLTITLPIKDGKPFTGIRFYSRKKDESVRYQSDNNAEVADITLYDANGKAYAENGLTSVKGVEGPKDGDAGGPRYVDFNLKYRVSNVSKIVIVVKKLYNNHHWGSEEVRLIDDSAVTEAKTVAEIGQDAVVLGDIVADTGVIGENGIIRFITEFKQIADGAEIECFGTYVIRDDKYNKENVASTGVNVGVYNVSDENVGRQPVVGDTFSVDVKGISSDKYNTGVTAVSFVKIKGYENPIILNVISGVTVNGDRTVQLPATEATTGQSEE